jgi:DNA-binding NtrC family response regulator
MSRRIDMLETPTGCATDQHLALVIDDDARVYEFVAATLAAHGMKVRSFQTAKPALAAVDAAPPAVIFLDVALLQSDAIDVLNGLGKRDYRGTVHLMSGGRAALLEAVQRLGVRNGVTFGPALMKPVTRDAIVEAITRMGLSSPPLQPEGGAADTPDRR